MVDTLLSACSSVVMILRGTAAAEPVAINADRAGQLTQVIEGRPWPGLRPLAGQHRCTRIHRIPAIDHGHRRSPTKPLFHGVHLALVDTIEATSYTISSDCGSDREGEAYRVVTAFYTGRAL